MSSRVSSDLLITLLLATRNPHKVRELRRLFRGFPIRCITLDCFPGIPPVKENGATFRANAIQKAVATSRHTILPVLAEDSGLEVRALNGRPGVRSARFAGPAQNDSENLSKLLREMSGIPAARRQARFLCVMALAIGGRLVRTFQGDCPGSIALRAAGRGGFGYDPLFIPRGRRKTTAQLGSAEKDRLSHRGKAAGRLRQWLKINL